MDFYIYNIDVITNSNQLRISNLNDPNKIYFKNYAFKADKLE